MQEANEVIIMPESTPPQEHPWRVRFALGITMLLLALVGLVLTTVRQDGAWSYWKTVVPIFAALSLSYTLYLRWNRQIHTTAALWQELCHWGALLGAVYLISTFVQSGVMGRLVAGLQVITLLGLTTFTLGIYVEPSFLVIGIVLGTFAACAAILSEYLTSLLIPLLLVAAVALYLLAKRKKKHPHPDEFLE